MGPFGPKTGPKPRNWNRNATAVSFKTSQLPGAGKTAVQSTSAQVLAPSRGLMPSAYPVRKVPGIRRNTSRVIIQRAKLAPSEHLRFPLCKRKLFALQCKIMIHSAGTCRPEYVGINPHLSHSERPSRRLPRIFPRGAGNATRRLLSRVRVLTMQVARGVDTAAK